MTFFHTQKHHTSLLLPFIFSIPILLHIIIGKHPINILFFPQLQKEEKKKGEEFHVVYKTLG